VSLQVTNGLTGLFSLGHPAFMTIGAYVAAILTYPTQRKGFMRPDLPAWLAGQQWDLLPALLAGAVAATLAAGIVGACVLRLKGHYLAVATLGLIIIVRVVINNQDGYTRGGLGLSGVARLTDLWWVYAWTVLAVYVAWRIKHASLGRAMLAIRENEMAARCMGIDVFRMRLLAFVIGAFFAGIAGGLMVHLVSVITPGSYGIPLAFNLVVMVVIGGTGSITGAIVAAVTISLLGEALKPIEETLELYGLSQVLIALGLIVVLRLRPQGLFGSSEPGLLRATPRAAT
jgi:branched-chain amino acid transport system permease protein